MKSTKLTLVMLIGSLSICGTANAKQEVEQFIKANSHNGKQQHYLTEQARLLESIIVTPPTSKKQALTLDGKAMRNVYCLAYSYHHDLVKTHKVLTGLHNNIFDTYAEKAAYKRYSKFLENVDRKTSVRVKC
ncbi:hypothetical protein [Photobacterium leiognathi]|uniref:hypothetical protein n=1 Tax=Photobacterium leiognathi TaxID=553611 RepID=UPI002982B573|nr:hypothetical protein [Photobacterium leiognathi]